MTGLSYSKAFIGDNSSGFTSAPKETAITGVNVHMDNDIDVFVCTDGNVLEVNLPVCNSTQDAEDYATYILNALSTYQYQPYEATGALLNPAYQLGDGITAHAVYSGIYSKKTTFSRLMRAEASAPYTEEVNNEYPFINGAQRKQTRKYSRLESEMESEFTIQAGQIAAKVSKLSPTGQTSFSWNMDDTSHKWYANGTQVMKVDQYGLEVNGKVTATSGTIGGCTIENGVLKVGTANVTSISIGNNFYVDSNGNMTANNATITGMLTVGGNQISATNLYTGAYQSANNYPAWNGASASTSAGGYCYGGAGQGYDWGNTKSQATSSLPSGYFGILSSSALSTGSINCSGNCRITTAGYLQVWGYNFSPQLITDGGGNSVRVLAV